PHPLSPLSPQSPFRRQRPEGARRDDARLVVDLSLRRKQPAGSVLEILHCQLLPRRAGPGGAQVLRPWAQPCGPAPCGNGCARAVLAHDAGGGLAFLRLLLLALVLPGLGAELCRGLPGALSLPARE